MANTMEATTTMNNPIVMNQSGSGRSDHGGSDDGGCRHDGGRSDHGGRSVETVEATPFQIQLTHSTMADVSTMADPTTGDCSLTPPNSILEAMVFSNSNAPNQASLMANAMEAITTMNIPRANASDITTTAAVSTLAAVSTIENISTMADVAMADRSVFLSSPPSTFVYCRHH